MKNHHLSQIPPCTWNRPIGLGWDKPYTVRNPSNLDDGAWHGMPLGGFGAGCIGRSSKGDFNLWHIDGGEHTFKSIPACQFSVFEQQEKTALQLIVYVRKHQKIALYKLGNGIRKIAVRTTLFILKVGLSTKMYSFANLLALNFRPY